MKWFVGATVFLLTNEALFWSWALARHAYWMDKHRELIHCKNLNCRMTMLASIMAGTLSTLVGVWYICYSIDSQALFYRDSLLVCGIQLSHIHFMALLARCTELPRELWPLPSQWLSKYVVRRLIKNNPSPICDQRRRKGDL